MVRATPTRHEAPPLFGARAKRGKVIMTEAFGALLDSGLLYFVVGAVICVLLGVGAVYRLFKGASKAEPPDPPERRRHKH
jgi:hypothetical protein